MKQAISPYLKLFLRESSKLSGEKSYGDWLKKQKSSRDDEAKAALYRATDSASAGYGERGEELAKDGLLGGGYAAYLQSEADRKKEAALTLLQSETAKSAADKAAGYAEYLRELREGQLSSMEEAANEALNTIASKKKTIIPSLTEKGFSPRQIAEVLKHYKGELAASEQPSFLSSVTRYLEKMHYSYENAYIFCRNTGIDEEKSKEIALLVTGRADKESSYLWELMNQEPLPTNDPLEKLVNSFLN